MNLTPLLHVDIKYSISKPHSHPQCCLPNPVLQLCPRAANSLRNQLEGALQEVVDSLQNCESLGPYLTCDDGDRPTFLHRVLFFFLFSSSYRQPF